MLAPFRIHIYEFMVTDRPHLPALTSVRFFAALHVFVFHMYAMKITSGAGWTGQISSIGYVGVSLFFLLSGFILVYTYAGRDVPAGECWRARFARIYPAYLFSLLVTAPFFFYVCIASLTITLLYVWLKPDGIAFVDDNSSNLNWLNVLKFNPLVRFPEFLLGACCGFLFLRGSVDRKWATPLILAGLAYFALVVVFARVFHIPSCTTPY